jgi:hypothetical protein
MIFITESNVRIEADSWEEAELKCPKGLTIIGKWVEDIYVDESVADYWKSKLN